ncbi:hypothetical protein A7K93_08990 [Candidatus Methylacidiphilum fumarolicum]|uniref:Class I SAM-dependent methyltransferase n=2 Tax=Candidatus Methylacidiphilum fumarolicum TaxID=591154 RepID=I0JXH9_METFB|nr:hypothetical protein [Candidatus Methylacidiphilum fumarolicum]MBW6415276.1 hypothetical protein [Candidatus Methylacidiphilum fumarolicum]TFE69256.1 hypothetical protein A7K73_06250 [Candidatus Methylacidiphilum fumarolicum]TFE72219.1 hypothetical protein A7K72_09250 [Candidatus Methylacidiphilum fumarolicum]TFE72360.1 hypothetical protein A7K93_08990 [Candidatus Methylacidiphilum fumarolicum]TFE76982.1 hypothetical protein A7D33_07165 [Candidatus Methylacidiphilum fumarolicum]
MQRKLEEKEYLDELAYDSYLAKKGREGLKKINYIMGNFVWFKKRLRQVVSTQGTVHFIEIGAGDGSMGRFLYADPLLQKNLLLTGIDRVPRPQHWPVHWPWIQTDLFVLIDSGTFASGCYQGILANMVLHHFSSAQLAIIGNWIVQLSPLYLFCIEPLRSPLSLFELFLLRLAGLNQITFHDGWLSIKSGFMGLELPELLNLSSEQWQYKIDVTLLGAYRLEATKK